MEFHLFEQQSLLLEQESPFGLQTGPEPGSSHCETDEKVTAKAPSTVRSSLSQVVEGLAPQAPKSWPTTWPLPLTTGEPELPPSLSPRVASL